VSDRIDRISGFKSAWRKTVDSKLYLTRVVHVVNLRWRRTMRTISLNDSTVAGLEQLTRGFGKHCPETDYLRENGFFGEFPYVCPEPVLGK
jgi:hypothetical protein